MTTSRALSRGMRKRRVCGTETGYRRHRAYDEIACQACCDAHAFTSVKWRARFRIADRPLQYRAAREGREPAEALTTADRRRLVAELVDLGATDVEIAQLTRMTTYTTARIRADLGLKPNLPSASTSTPGVA